MGQVNAVTKVDQPKPKPLGKSKMMQKSMGNVKDQIKSEI